jgi:hypothetical protein
MATTETINPLPQNNDLFVTDTINFLQHEDAGRYNRQFAGFVANGGTAAVSGSLSHTISALEAFVHGYYVAQPAVTITYTANRRTFCFVDSLESRSPEVTFTGGSGATFKQRTANLVFVECANGSSQPKPSVDGLVALLYADTSASNITNVTDLRLLSPLVSSTKIIDPARYGVIGDGLTDNTSVIQQMFDALPLGSVIRFGQGIFLISSVTIPKGCIVSGVGDGSTGTIIRLTTPTLNGFNVTTTDSVAFAELRIDASVTRTAGYAISFNGVSKTCVVERVSFIDQFNSVGFTNGRQWNINRCTFTNGRGHDIDVAIGTGDADAVISACVFDSTLALASSGIRIRRATALSIYGNIFHGHDYGIICDPEIICFGIDIHDNIFRDQTLIPINFIRTSGSGQVQLFKIKANLIGASTLKLINIGNGISTIYINGLIVENGFISVTPNVIAIDLSSDTNCIIAENNFQLPNGVADTSVCIHVSTTSQGTNIGHNGYIGKTFVDNDGGSGFSAIPLFIATGILPVDPPSIGANALSEVLAPAPGTGINVNDIVVLNRPTTAQLPGQLDFVGCRVSAPDQVSIFLRNSTGSSVDAGVSNWSGFVIRSVVS